MPTVLVVSRERSFRSLLRAQLQEEGFEALGFESLPEAGELLQRERSALLVFDLAEASSEERAWLARDWVPTRPVLVVAPACEPAHFPGVQVLRRPLTIRAVVAAVRAAAALHPGE